MSVETRLAQHLAKWGLRKFSREEDYYAFQRERLSPKDLQGLHELAEKRQGGIDAKSDQDFYDVASQDRTLPVLYSQRFSYFQTVGSAIAEFLEPGKAILDFGCGVGILTTWYASEWPDCEFTGVDRSVESIAVAQQQANVFKLPNVSFHACAVPHDQIAGEFDVIIATHALFQSETEPGLPSRSWNSFDRNDDSNRQYLYELRTGIGERLDWLIARLNPKGRLLVFEKATHLGRRVLFQRALSARGLHCDRAPVFLHYSSLGEHIVDGPLYSLTRKSVDINFNEAPVFDPVDRVYRCHGRDAHLIWSKYAILGRVGEPIRACIAGQDIQWQLCRTGVGLLCGYLMIPAVFSGVLVGSDEDEVLLESMIDNLIHPGKVDMPIRELLFRIWPMDQSSDTSLSPLYENHSPSAQDVWQRLPNRVIHREKTQEGSGGQQFHVELGASAEHWEYLYWANTYDQRQLVIMEVERKQILEDYFSESGEEN